MQIIPAINCEDYKTLSRLVEQSAGFLSDGDWIHIDVTDGKFTDNVTWNNPEELRSIKATYPGLNLEIHLMVENPDEVVESWLQAGANRIVVQLETISSPDMILDLAQKYGVDVMLSIIPSTPADLLLPHTNSFRYFQILAVEPGLAGQRFKMGSLEKIQFLRDVAPDAKIEVDGGMTPETARLVKIAGADMVTAASYIFNSQNQEKAYKELNGSVT